MFFFQIALASPNHEAPGLDAHDGFYTNKQCDNAFPSKGLGCVLSKDLPSFGNSRGSDLSN